MPYVVPVQIRKSPIQGRGVFALVDIPQGTVVWRFIAENPAPVLGFDPLPNRILTQQQMRELPEEEIVRTLNGGYSEPDLNEFADLRDGGQFTNHSDNPVLAGGRQAFRSYAEAVCVAVRDIKRGEELTESYHRYLSTIGAPWIAEMIAKYVPELAELERRLDEEAKMAKLAGG